MRKEDLFSELSEDLGEFFRLKGGMEKFAGWELKAYKKNYCKIVEGEKAIKFNENSFIVDPGFGIERGVVLFDGRDRRRLALIEDIKYGVEKIRIRVWYSMDDKNIAFYDEKKNDVVKVEFINLKNKSKEYLAGVEDLREGVDVFQTDFGPRDWLSVEWQWTKITKENEELKLSFKKLFGPEHEFFREDGFSRVGLCGMFWYFLNRKRNVVEGFDLTFPGVISKDVIVKFLFEDFLFKKG